MQVAPRIEDKVGEWIGTIFPSRNNGAEYVLEAFFELYRRTIFNLRGRFTGGELSLMIDAMRGNMLTPLLSGQHLAISCMDAMRLDGLDKKWNIDRDLLEGKMTQLTLFEAAVLEIWSKGFWESKFYDKQDGLEEWISQLAE